MLVDDRCTLVGNKKEKRERQGENTTDWPCVEVIHSWTELGISMRMSFNIIPKL